MVDRTSDSEIRHSKFAVTIGASRITAEGNGEQLQRLLLTREVKTLNPPQNLAFAPGLSR